MSDEVSYGLVMPFVVCASQGGPYSDDAYVAGWEAGAFDQLLKLQPLQPGHSVRLPQAFHADNRPQLDLIAMKHDFAIEFDLAAEDWVWMTLRKPV